MVDIKLLSETFAVLFLSVVSPGPDFAMVLRNALIYGRKAGFFSALGIACGCLISFTIVISGLKILLTYPVLKIGLSVICGLYLIYIGVLSIKSRAHHKEVNYTHKPVTSFFTYYRNGLFTNIFNPKLYTLSTAILAYTEQHNPSFLTNVIIVIGQAIITLIWFSSVSYVFSYRHIRDKYFKREQVINIILGLVLIIIGSRIITLCL